MSVAAGISGGVVVPLLGYSYLLGAHPALGEPLPFWVTLAIPFSAIGPESPSVAVFFLLLLINVALWGTIFYAAGTFFRWLIHRRSDRA